MCSTPNANTWRDPDQRLHNATILHAFVSRTSKDTEEEILLQRYRIRCSKPCLDT
jgi:hypothetical protein